MELAGKTALITGGRRIGAQLALMLADRGMNVVLSYLSSRDVAERTAADCERRGVRAVAVRADLREPDQVDHLVDAAVSAFGSVDVLVNLTSIYRPTPFDQLTPEDFHELLASNLTAPYWTALAAARQMRQQPLSGGLQGKIVHFTDWAVDRPYRGFLPYLVAKGALATFTKALSVELAPTITVNAIAPGTVEPPPNLALEKLEQIRKSSALARIGSADDVNRAVLYLLEGTDFVTGEIYRVDGGRFLGPVGESPADSGPALQ
ncbi:MAG TPA: SDR family oxidoreductase [Planctomycetaceae bacterium]|nr:SDR family oxidoreductase [Planctomycetaceae bacterium]